MEVAPTHGRRHKGGRKRLRILVVHDFDLKSSAKLAESSLLSSNNIRNQRNRSDDPLLGKSVDFCIAVNATSKDSIPDVFYDPDDELLPYYQGQQKRDRMLKTTTTTMNTRSRSRPMCSPYSYTWNGTEVSHLRGRARIGKKTQSSSFRSIPIPVPLPPASQPIFYDSHDTNKCDDNYGGATKAGDDNDDNYDDHCDSGQSLRDPPTTTCNRYRISPEERAARRGLITAAISQLESIVCRVAYVLKEDSDDDDDDDEDQSFDSCYVHRRLTSNSLDIRNRWLPLLGGLGVAGLVGDPKGPPTERSSTSFPASADSDYDSDSNDDSPSVFPSEREGLQREIRGSSSSPVAVVPPCGDKGSHAEGITTAKRKGDGNNNHYFSRMLEGLLRSAHPLRMPDRERDGYTDRAEEDPFPGDLEGPRFQSIVVAAASASRKDPGTMGEAKPEIAQDPNEDLGKGESLPCPLYMQRQQQQQTDDDSKAFVKNHLLLEIVTGVEAPSSQSFCSNGSTTTVVVPGSLRTRGEFCLVDLVLDDEIDTDGNVNVNVNESIHNDIDIGPGSRPPRFNRWRVERTHFHRLESEENTRMWA
jgi:hypothetical protein